MAIKRRIINKKVRGYRDRAKDIDRHLNQTKHFFFLSRFCFLSVNYHKHESSR